MGMPAAVLRQAELAEKIRKEAYENQPPEDPSRETPPIETPDPDPEPPANEGLDYKALYEEEKQRRLTLEGKYNSEVPELIRQNKALADDLTTIKVEISSLKAEKGKVPEPAVPDPDEGELESLREQYPEVAKMSEIQLRRVLKERDKKIASLEERLNKIESGFTSVERRVQKTEVDGFSKEMDRLVDKRGSWREMNTQGSEFLRWANVNMIAGHSRYDLMMSSYAKGDFKAVAEHFNEFIKVKNPGTAQEIPDDEGNLGLPKPNSGGGTPPKDKTAEDKKKPITRSYVKKTLTDIAVGKYKKDPKKEAQLKAEIDEKAAKGLIIDG